MVDVKVRVPLVDDGAAVDAQKVVPKRVGAGLVTDHDPRGSIPAAAVASAAGLTAALRTLQEQRRQADITLVCNTCVMDLHIIQLNMTASAHTIFLADGEPMSVSARMLVWRSPCDHDTCAHHAWRFSIRWTKNSGLTGLKPA